jgi:hypothetical protein
MRESLRQLRELQTERHMAEMDDAVRHLENGANEGLALRSGLQRK